MKSRVKTYISSKILVNYFSYGKYELTNSPEFVLHKFIAFSSHLFFVEQKIKTAFENLIYVLTKIPRLSLSPWITLFLLLSRKFKLYSS